MKKSIPALFVTSVLALIAASTASAQLQIQIDTLTANQLTITILGGAGSAFSGSPTNGLALVDFSPGPAMEWMNANPTSAVINSGGTTNLGGAFYVSSINSAAGDGVYIGRNTGDFTAGEYFTSNTQITWTGTNFINLAALSGESIYAYWGVDGSSQIATGVLQATVPAAAVPEPSTYAMLAGLGALGLVCWRRRRAAA